MNVFTVFVFFKIFCSQIFCDFGSQFVVSDTDGEQPVSVMIAAVTKVSFFVQNFLRSVCNQLSVSLEIACSHG
jgi:hypothetical protein